MNFKNKEFCEFFAISGCDTHCAEMAGDGPKQPAHEIFSIKRRF